MMIDVDDPFARAGDVSPDDDPERVTGGRYRLPDLIRGDDGDLVTGVGPRAGGWQRVTTCVRAISDAWAIDRWHQRRLIEGLVRRHDLFDLACGLDFGDLDAVQALADQALHAGGAYAPANTGTALHRFREAEDLGISLRHRARWSAKLRNYADGHAAHGLKPVPDLAERCVVVLRYGLAGRLDVIDRDTRADCLVIDDLKSAKAFHTWTEVAAQLAAYAMADAMWDRPSRQYVAMPPVSQDLAVVTWMPVEHPDPESRDRVEVYDVDLEKGRKRLDLAHEVGLIRSADRSARQDVARLRPLPVLSEVEAYARRLDAVGSPAEGSALWREITEHGLGDSPELIELAREIVGRFSPS